VEGRVKTKLIGAMAALLAMTTAAAAWPARGNDTGGIIPWSPETARAAPEIAAAHCARYRKYERITSLGTGYGSYIGFACLWNPYGYQSAVPPVMRPYRWRDW
jgi:hypothetical protein